MTRAYVELSHTIDAGEWQRRHGRGEVPDALPYGLDRLTAHGVDVVTRPTSGPLRRTWSKPLRLLGGYQWAEDFVRRPEADVRLCWDERAGIPAALSNPLGGPPVVSGVIWLTESGRSSLGRPLERRALRRMAAVWALSSAQIPVLRDEWGVPAARLHHLPFGIDTDFFGPLPPSPGTDVVASAGNDRHRDHATLLSAVAEIRRRRPSTRLELATRHDLNVQPPDTLHRGLTHGHVREMYGRAAVVAVATRSNLHVSGVSVVLEAMASARPVVATRTAGTEDYITDGDTGLLVPPGDVDGLAKAVGHLLEEPEEAAAMGARARHAVEQRFSTERQAARLAEILDGT